MAQADYVVANGTGAAVRSDLNGQLAAIVSNNSGVTEPATMYAYQWWADTTTGLLKIRNAANNDWITIGTLADANLGLLAQSGGTLTGALLADDSGTAALPAIAFDGDPNTGIFSPGADQLGIATNGVERVEFGTTEVVFNDGGANYDFRIEGDTNLSLFFVDASADTVEINGDVTIADKIIHSGDTNTAIRFPAADIVSIETDGSERARIDSSGKLLSPNGAAFYGTVSNSGNGAIMESGSNANGNFTKYADGTQHAFMFGFETRSTSGRNTTTLTLPVTFVDAAVISSTGASSRPYTSVACLSTSVPETATSISTDSETTTTLEVRIVRSNSTNTAFMVFIIGRWY